MIISESQFNLYSVYCIGEAATSSALAYDLKTKHYFECCPTITLEKNRILLFYFQLC
jgi:hypothetical protein